MSVGTCPTGHRHFPSGKRCLRLSNDRRPTTLQVLLVIAIRPIVDQATQRLQNAGRRSDGRINWATRSITRQCDKKQSGKTQSIRVVVVNSRGSDRQGGSWISRLLAQQYELAGQRERLLVSGMPEMRRKALVRRAEFSRIRTISK